MEFRINRYVIRFVTLIILMVFISVNSYSQDSYDYESYKHPQSSYSKFRSEGVIKTLNSYALKGPVEKVLQKYDDLFSYQNKWTDEYIFSKDSNLIFYMFQDSNNKKETMTYSKHYTFNKDRLLQKMEKVEYVDRKRGVSYISTYNTEGFLVSSEKVRYNFNYYVIGPEKINYLYNKIDSNITVSKSPHYEFDIEGYSDGDSLNFIFNSKNKLVYETQFYSFGNRSQGYTYDSLGRVCGVGFRSPIKYDSLNNIVYKQWYDSGIDHVGQYYSMGKMSFEYNEKNLLSVIRSSGNTTYDNNRGLYFGSHKLDSLQEELPIITKYTYKYDNYGNWVLRETYDRNNKLTATIIRTISYFL